MLFHLLVLSQTYVLASAKPSFPGLGRPIWGRVTAPKKTIINDSRFQNVAALELRGGYQDGTDDEHEMTLDEKVQAAMKKLGLEQPSGDDECAGGACPVPSPPSSSSSSSSDNGEGRISEKDVAKRAVELAQSMQVDESLAMAALGATASHGPNNERTYSESAARAMIQQELDLISTIPEDCDEVQQLVSEGNDLFLSRRALAFAEMNMDDARAILLADAEDLREEQQEQEIEQQAATPAPKANDFKTVTVNSNFDPTKVGAGGASSAAAPPTPSGAPKPAKKSDVVFEATTAQIQELVLESPVPVLLDVYADWCGPCKVLGPVLEDMAVKSGGMFRLVKVNSDNERPVSAALGVEALPSVFGIRDGKILHMFKGMPRDEESMKNFMMGLLMPGAKFTPPVTEKEKQAYEEMTGKLIKMAGAASFSFSARERLQDRISTQLDKLVEETGDASLAEESAMVVRSLLSNVIKSPAEQKYRKVNLANKKIAAKIAAFPSAVAMLKNVGFAKSADEQTMTVGKGKKIINVAPLMVARDSIDKWIDQSRYEIARAARKRKDEEDRARLEAEGHFDKDEEEEEEVEEKVVDMDACQLKVRMEGKKKVMEMSFSADDPIKKVLDELPTKPSSDDEEVQITCVAKRLILKSTDAGAFEKTFRELGLSPAAAVVVGFGGSKAKEESKVKLSEKAALKKKKKGSHTMQSVGIYSKDDNAKAELIDGGGGVWYEHDVTDDEEATKEEETSEKSSEDEAEATNSDDGEAEK